MAVAPITIKELATRYIDIHSNGALEKITLSTIGTHMRHIRRSLGERFALARLKMIDLQTHVSKRLKDPGIRQRKLSPITLRKEMASFRAVWNWGVRAGLISGVFPDKGLVYPKTEEKPPFQTYEDNERQLARGTYMPAQERDLWDCLFLTVPEVQQLLAHVRAQSLSPVTYPMFCFAAYTGARRSEMMRCRVADIDLDAQRVMIREKKRTRGHRTNRIVPLPPVLVKVLSNWLARHPGGPETFCLPLPNRKSGAVPLSSNDAVNVFEHALHGSKWDKLRGWHVFRHSFASNCAAKCIDQRLIDSWMGHQTEEMRKRYRHLIPNQEQAAITAVFGPVLKIAQ